jgi:ABC-type transporter Mla maintaining outer membrane lipid asymmetry permease subunit MlaE
VRLGAGEVVPYAVANFFCVPAVVSITTEIGSMRLSRELDALEVLGLDPSEVAFVPKAVALIIVAPLFCFVVFFSGLAGVWFGSNLLLGKSLLDFGAVFVSDVSTATYIKTLVKAVLIAFCMATSAAFGVVIAAVRTMRSHAASTDGHIPTPTPARMAAPYAAPSSAATVSTGRP